jgi:hypothetical protein
MPSIRHVHRGSVVPYLGTPIPPIGVIASRQSGDWRSQVSPSTSFTDFRFAFLVPVELEHNPERLKIAFGFEKVYLENTDFCPELCGSACSYGSNGIPLRHQRRRCNAKNFVAIACGNSRLRHFGGNLCGPVKRSPSAKGSA